MCERCDGLLQLTDQGKCLCSNGAVPDELGTCQTKCKADHCSSCEYSHTGSSEKCSRCIDPLAILKDGKCSCPANETFD